MENYGFFSINKHGHVAMSSEHSSLVLYTVIAGDALINNGPQLDVSTNTTSFITRTISISRLHKDRIFIPFLRYPQNSAGVVIGQTMTRTEFLSYSLSITIAYTGKIPHLYIFGENAMFTDASDTYGMLVRNAYNEITFDSGRKMLSIHAEGILTVPKDAQYATGQKVDPATINVANANKKETEILKAFKAVNTQLTTNQFLTIASTRSNYNIGKSNVSGVNPWSNVVYNASKQIGLVTLNALYPSYFIRAKLMNINALLKFEPSYNYLYYAPIKRLTVATSSGSYYNSDSSSLGKKTITQASAALARSYYAMIFPERPDSVVSFYCMYKEVSEYQQASSSGWGGILGGLISIGTLALGILTGGFTLMVLGGILTGLFFGTKTTGPLSAANASVQESEAGFLSTTILVAKATDYE